jgi:hypothetical protein
VSTVSSVPWADARCISLPAPRGPISEQVFAALRRPPASGIAITHLEPPDRPLCDHDFQLALYILYELHYASIVGIDELWEWDPGLLEVRAALEHTFEQAVAEVAGEPHECGHEDVGAELERLVEEDDGPSLSRYMESQGTREQMIEHVIHRSAYQLKEADPHTWTVPRLSGAAKAALVEIQFDEYGEGRADRMHSSMFAATMAGLGLDPRYGAYVAVLPGITLATVNLMSFLGLHRRFRGALVGHLATFEMTSSIPNRRYGNALRRLGYGREVTAFYDEHVQADAVHESIAAWDLAGGLARAEPALIRDIQIGARALLALESLWAQHLLECWERGASSLFSPEHLERQPQANSSASVATRPRKPRSAASAR